MDKDIRLRESPNRWLLRLLIAALALIIVILLIVTAFLLVTQKPVDLSGVTSYTPSSAATPEEQFRTTSRPFRKYPKAYKKFTFDDLFSGKIFLKDSYTFAWTKDGKLIKKKDEFFGSESGSVVYSPDSFTPTDFIDDGSFITTLSSNVNYAYDTKIIRQLFRHSNEEVYIIRKIENGKVLNITFPVGPTGNGTEIVSLFVWNPNKDRNDFIFVSNNNIYYQSDPERAGTAVKITEDGAELLKYGVADWLYEEEIFSTPNAIWWSESGRYVSYLRFDDRSVHKVFIPRYLSTYPYTQYQEIPYPKAGVENNPIVTLYVWDRQNNKAVAAFPPNELVALNQSYYIFSNTWIQMPKDRLDLGDERLLTVWANREQTTMYITLCNAVDCILTYTQSFVMSGRSMWAEPSDFLKVLETNTGFFILLPHQYKDGNIYNHAAHVLIKRNGGGRVSSWHGGSFDIDSLKGYDSTNDILTFIGSGGEIGSKKLFRVQKATTQRYQLEDLSAKVADCEYGSYDVSPTGATATLSCSSTFRNTRFWIMNLANPEKNRLLEGEGDIPLPFDLPTITYESIRLPSGYEVNVGIMKPPKFDPTRKYPVLVDVYGGPNSVRVKKATPAPNFIHYCSNYELIIVWIDARGTGGKGWNFKAPVYKMLGHMEAIDTIDATRTLSNKYSYFDQSNIAIFGWSYGGFLSTHVAVLDQGQLFKCAVAVAPVTDMQLYDSAYTERYMGMPLENASGYNASNLIEKAGLLNNVTYLLAHGEADDNVHYQHSARFSEALQQNMIHFTQLVYSNQDHSMGGRQRHLFREIGQFLAHCFNLTDNS